MASADHLTQAGYLKLRNAVSTMLNSNTSPTAESNFHAENLIKAGYIDVEAVFEHIIYKDSE
ncbi:hypothetical protein QEH42_gp259 [Microbacterium phage Pumpernickel]|uniref:Uncharacterized protein n=1 Tax=Microbacterium phage Pumpernickel TaxID=2885983 RepID=A0AAE8YBL3_9CAUD|nr:hypothetical protein QEH42_gp259 [Microbacterium phage Pumpernickel]UDL15959.1 hypothetical protein SEA_PUMPERNICKEL_209 [Microbacterium phage Pumpernickel]